MHPLQATLSLTTLTMQNLCTSMISSPFNPPEKTRPSSVLTLAQPSASSSLKITNRSSPYTSSGLQNRLPNSFHFISQVLINLLYTLFIPHMQVYPHHLHHLSLHHSFTPGSKPIFSTNPFPTIDFWFSPDCLHMDTTRICFSTRWFISLVSISFSRFLATRSRVSWFPFSFRMQVKNSSLYHIAL